MVAVLAGKTCAAGALETLVGQVSAEEAGPTGKVATCSTAETGRLVAGEAEGIEESAGGALVAAEGGVVEVSHVAIGAGGSVVTL